MIPLFQMATSCLVPLRAENGREIRNLQWRLSPHTAAADFRQPHSGLLSAHRDSLAGEHIDHHLGTGMSADNELRLRPSYFARGEQFISISVLHEAAAVDAGFVEKRCLTNDGLVARDAAA